MKGYFFRKIGLFVLELTCITHVSFFCERYQFNVLLLSYSIAFGVYFYFLRNLKVADIKLALIFAVLARFIAIFSTPHLSDDFFRFFWDGSLTLNGINPYIFKPTDLQPWLSTQNETVKYAFSKMNSPDYNSVYPPIAQSVFATAVFLFPKSIYGATVFIKFINFLAECGTLYFLYKLTKKINPKAVLVYSLNPFLIVELCGNAHTEALMIVFFAAALYYLQKFPPYKVGTDSGRQLSETFVPSSLDGLSKSVGGEKKSMFLAGLFLALSTASKLFVLLYVLFFARNLNFRKGIYFMGVFTIACIIFFIPFFQTIFSPTLRNNSLGLFFNRFEFNASVFYILKFFGEWLYGFDTIHLVSPILMCIFIVFAIILHLKKSFFTTDLQTFSRACLMLFYAYIICSTTVHPWYLAFPVFFAAMSGYYFPLVHSFFIVLSYAGYSQGSSKSIENLWFVLIEYSVVLVVFLFEQNPSTYQTKRSKSRQEI